MRSRPMNLDLGAPENIANHYGDRRRTSQWAKRRIPSKEQFSMWTPRPRLAQVSCQSSPTTCDSGRLRSRCVFPSRIIRRPSDQSMSSSFSRINLGQLATPTAPTASLQPAHASPVELLGHKLRSCALLQRAKCASAMKNGAKCVQVVRRPPDLLEQHLWRLKSATEIGLQRPVDDKRKAAA
jgi:hypothetical protein